MKSETLENLVIINDIDIWKEFGAFLTEDKKGGRDNLTAIMAPSKVKAHVGVNIREENGTKYSEKLEVKNEERNVTLHFALFAGTRSEWLTRYSEFIKFLKQGKDGWLNIHFPELGLTMRMHYIDSGQYKPLTYLWREGKHASRFKITFKEPIPTF